ncbi:TolC family protein [Aliikangiella maris]|uniref:TolC family protein n=2 Tax=Aliikangiella maris TaxID=3162458 RepID=A0ABV2BY20_9GAMM
MNILKKVRSYHGGRCRFVRTIRLNVLTFAIAYLVGQSVVNAQSSILNFEQTIKLAQQYDLQLAKNQFKQKSLIAKSRVAQAMPLPVASLGLNNLPSDSFRLNQEAMTQLSVGLSQVFPRGNSRELHARQLTTLSEQYPLLNLDRKAQVAVLAGKLWLDNFYLAQSIFLIHQNRGLFEQLSDIAEKNYTAAVGQSRQHNIVAAQLELTRLDDRLTQLKLQQLRLIEQLSEWISPAFDLSENSTNQDFTDAQMSQQQENAQIKKQLLALNKQSLVLPEIKLNSPELVTNNLQHYSSSSLNRYLLAHPLILSFEKQIEANQINESLAKQEEKVQWKLSAGYGFRTSSEQSMMADRPDLLSVGISFDLPWSNSERQHNQLISAKYQTAASKTEKWQKLREFHANFEQVSQAIQILKQRKKLFTSKLLPQVKAQTASSLAAYTHDDGNFLDVIQARIALLNATLDKLLLDVEEVKLLHQLNYYLISDSPEKTYQQSAKLGDKNEQ